MPLIDNKVKIYFEIYLLTKKLRGLGLQFEALYGAVTMLRMAGDRTDADNLGC